MNIALVDITEDNFFSIVDLKSDENQEEYFQIYERWVGSNTFFLAACHTFGYTARAVYDGDTLIGFATHGLRKETGRFELVSMMLGHQFQGKGYATSVLQALINDMVSMYDCDEIYVSVIHDNVRAISLYEKLGFEPTGEIEEGHHPEPVYCFKVHHRD